MHPLHPSLRNQNECCACSCGPEDNCKHQTCAPTAQAQQHECHRNPHRPPDAAKGSVHAGGSRVRPVLETIISHCNAAEQTACGRKIEECWIHLFILLVLIETFVCFKKCYV